MRDMNLVLWIHVMAAGSAVCLSLLQVWVPRGSFQHKTLGYLWVTSLATTALSSFFIKEMGGFWGFSWIHGLSLYTLVGLVAAVYYAKQKALHLHRKNMLYLALGLFIAGGFALLPGRRIGDLIWSQV